MTTNHNTQFLSGGGEMGERIRNFDWEKTSLGTPDKWEQSLKTCVRIMLTSSQPIWIGWGKDLIKIYNDPYKAIVGGKHPEALGQPASVVWRDIWNDIEPMLKKVMENDEGTYVESQLLIMERNNYPEETYYTFSYTPIPGDVGGTAGMICANTDDTARIINERALQTLHDLGHINYKEKNLSQIYLKAAEVLSNNNKDFPSAIFYEVNENEMTAEPVAWAGKESEYHTFPKTFSFKDPKEGTLNISKAIKENKIVLSENNGRRNDTPKGFWPLPPKQFLHIPLSVSNSKFPSVVLSLGLNLYRKYDHAYQQFIQLIADQLTLEINNIHAFEEERKRALALAEIDKAKTVFFNNISHEFRTPLTLMLGPLEELMQPKAEIGSNNLLNIETTYRNALRLLKLVNNLLDFSRIESGKQHADFQQVDIAEFTRNVVGNFRSLIEKADLKLIVNVLPVTHPVFVDKDMWEKVIFNLLSNAYKYTLHGSITINLFDTENKFILEVVDTGIGIPEKELPHMFERFHRVQGSTGRTYEGTGIGLSMIKEFINLMGGKIEVNSLLGKGSKFIVTMPVGSQHLSPQQVNGNKDISVEINSYKTSNRSDLLIENNSYVRELISDEKEITDSSASTVLIVDDNADMREYIRNSLKKNFNIITAKDGADALQKMKQQLPDIIVSDIMMPVMDGIQLLKEIKQASSTAQIPVILLSARAGEESKIEGYDIGADDYLIKPFSAKELIARIRSQLKIMSARRHTEKQLRNLFLQAPIGICVFRGPSYVIEVANEKMLEIWGKKIEQIIHKPLFEGMPDAVGQGFEEILYSVYTTGNRFVTPEASINLLRNGKMQEVYMKFVYEALFDEDGKISGIMALADEITEQVIAKKNQLKDQSKIQEAEERLRLATEAEGLSTWDLDVETSEIIHSPRLAEIFGHDLSKKISHQEMRNQIHSDDRIDVVEKAFEEALRTGIYTYEARVIKPNGTAAWVRTQGKVFYNQNNRPVKIIGTLRDITEEKQHQQILLDNERKFRLLADSMPQFIWTGDSNGNLNYFNESVYKYSGLTPEQLDKEGWLQIVHPEEREENIKQWVNSVKTGKEFVFEHRFRREDGKYRWQLSRAIPQLNKEGKIQMWVGTSTDIEEQKLFTYNLKKQVDERTKELKELNDALKKSEERYHLMVDEIQDYAIIYLNPEGIIENWNRGARKIKGYEANEIIGKDFSIFYTEEDKETNLPQRVLKLASGTGKALHEGWRVRKNGDLFWASIVITAMHDDAGNIIGFSKLTHDLTEKKQVDDKIKMNAKQLEQKNKELEKMNAELQSFAYVSSHDLQEPLRKIQTFATRILEKEFDNLTESGKNYFNRMQQSANKMQTLIEDLLMYSRTNTTEGVFKNTDLKELINEVKNDFREVLIEKNAVIDIQETCEAVVIPFQFRQLMQNLIGNSLKFSKQDIPAHVIINAHTAMGSSLKSDQLLPDTMYCHISVSDNGIGFEDEYKDRIFEVFQRLHGKAEYKGTGIGLAIVKKIVENHDGIITANGELNKGATFNIYIPSS